MPAAYNPASRILGRMQSLNISGNFLGPLCDIAPAILSRMLNGKATLSKNDADSLNDALDSIQALAKMAYPLPINFHPGYVEYFKPILDRLRRGLLHIEVRTDEDIFFSASMRAGMRALAGHVEPQPKQTENKDV